VLVEPLDEFVTSDQVHHELVEWLEFVRERDLVVLEPASSEAEARASLARIRQEVCGQVKAAREQLFEGVPG